MLILRCRFLVYHFCPLSGFPGLVYVLLQFEWYFASLGTNLSGVKLINLESWLSIPVFFSLWSGLSSLQFLKDSLLFVPFLFLDIFFQNMQIFERLVLDKISAYLDDFLVPPSSVPAAFLFWFNFFIQFF